MHKLDLTFRYPCIIADPIVIARMQRYDPGRMMTGSDDADDEDDDLGDFSVSLVS